MPAVLVIDEDPAIGEVVLAALRSAEYEVTVASRAADGIRLAKQLQPRAILLETRFTASSGFEILAQLREQQGPVSVAFLTRERSLSVRVRALQQGAVTLLNKPVDAGRLQGVVQRLCTLSPNEPVSGPVAEKLRRTIETVERDQLTGRLEISAPEKGSLVFEGGRLIQAQLGRRRGEAAIAEICRQEQLQYKLETKKKRTSEGLRIPRPASATLSPVAQLQTARQDIQDEEATVIDSEAVAQVAAELAPPELDPMNRSTERITADNRSTDEVGAAESGQAVEGLAIEGSRDSRPPFEEDDDSPTTALPLPAAQDLLVMESERGRDYIDDTPVSDEPPVYKGASGPTNTGPSRRPAAPVPMPHAATSKPRLAPPQAASSHASALSLSPSSPSSPSSSSPSSPPRAWDVDDEDPTLDAGDEPVEPAASDLPLSSVASSSETRPRNDQLLAAPDDDADSGFYEEDIPTSEQFSARAPYSAAGPAKSPASVVPTVAARPPAKPQAHEQAVGVSAANASLRGWIDAMGGVPLLLVMPRPEVGRAFEHALGGAVPVVQAHSGQHAYQVALDRRPFAIICDAALPDCEGRQLLAGLRCDYRVREIPFIIVSSQAVVAANQVQQVFDAVLTALRPRLEVLERAKGQQSFQGWVEPVGVSHLIRAMGAAGSSGRLFLRMQDHRNAEVAFSRGEICGVTVNSPQVSVGPFAMLQLVGFEWQEFKFHPETPDASKISLGDLQPLVETAGRQNNALLQRVYLEGVKQEDLRVDAHSLDSYMAAQPANAVQTIVALMGGEPPKAIGQSLGPESAIKSMLFEMRRKAVFCPTSLRATRGPSEGSWIVFQATQGERSTTSALTVMESPRYRRRWPVVVAACLTTVALAIGGIFLYRYLGS
jgi:DNA-binding response OmpR family regulator